MARKPDATRPEQPGDEAPPGTPGTGQNVCPKCKGDGHIGSRTCAECGGSGYVVEGIGGG